MTNCLQQAVNTIALCVPIYLLVQLNPAPLAVARFFTAVLTLSCIGVALGLLIGAFADDLQQAQALVAPTIVPLIMFSGYLIPFKQIPDFFRWLYHISFFQCVRVLCVRVACACCERVRVICVRARARARVRVRASMFARARVRRSCRLF